LDGGDLGNVVEIARIDQGPGCYEDEVGVEFFGCEFVCTRVVEHLIDVVVAVHDHH
jgi:hypothetical protein